MIELELETEVTSTYIIFNGSGGRDRVSFFGGAYDPSGYRQWHSNDVMDPYKLEKEDLR